jgi:hypothetical protein
VSYTVMTFVEPWSLTSRSNNCFSRDRSMIFGMWVHDHKVVCRTNIIDLSRKTKMLLPVQENTIQKTII